MSCPHTTPIVSHVLPGQFHLWSPGALPTPRKQPKSVAWGDPVRNKETLAVAHEVVQAGYELGPMCSWLWALSLASAASGLTLSCPPPDSPIGAFSCRGHKRKLMEAELGSASSGESSCEDEDEEGSSSEADEMAAALEAELSDLI